MPLLYKKAKAKVDRDYDKLIADGFTPVANEDGTSYSWINNETGVKRKSAGDPYAGIAVDAGFGDKLKRGARQRRLMSEKVTTELSAKGAKKVSDKAKAAAAAADAKSTDSKDSGPKRDKNEVTRLVHKPTNAETGSGVPDDMKEHVIGKGHMPMDGGEIRGNPLSPRSSYAPKDKLGNDKWEDKSPESVVYNEEEKNPTTPFMYIKPGDWEKLEPSARWRFWGRKYKSVRGDELENKRMGNFQMPFSQGSIKLGGGSAGEKMIDGERHILVDNPYFQERTFEVGDPRMASIIKSQSNIWDSEDPKINTVNIGGRDYQQVEETNWDRIGNMAAVLQGIIVPGGNKKLVTNSGLKGVKIGGNINKGSKAWNMGMEATAAEKVAKVTPRLVEGTKRFYKPITGTKTEISPDVIRRAADNVWKTIVNPTKKFPGIRTGYAPGLKFGGKLTLNPRKD